MLPMFIGAWTTLSQQQSIILDVLIKHKSISLAINIGKCFSQQIGNSSGNQQIWWKLFRRHFDRSHHLTKFWSDPYWWGMTSLNTVIFFCLLFLLSSNITSEFSHVRWAFNQATLLLIAVCNCCAAVSLSRENFARLPFPCCWAIPIIDNYPEIFYWGFFSVSDDKCFWYYGSHCKGWIFLHHYKLIFFQKKYFSTKYSSVPPVIVSMPLVMLCKQQQLRSLCRLGASCVSFSKISWNRPYALAIIQWLY